MARDEVRLLVARPSGVAHRQFHDLPGELSPGDLVVVNTSATVPAALAGWRQDGRPTVVHVSAELPDRSWAVELRRPDQAGPQLDATVGETIRLLDGLRLTLGQPYPDGSAPGPASQNPAERSSRLWRARPSLSHDLLGYLARQGHPIRYAHQAGALPLSDHQTIYAGPPGSAEMASAGRPFSAALLTRLLIRGVTLAPIVLHAGLSSQEAGEPPLPERFAVPADTTRLVNSARAAGRRVVAVGTTVTRALESAAEPDGTVHSASGWTDLVLGPERAARVVTGLITGLHTPEASHLLLLEAVAGAELVRAAYTEALQRDYLWHEFGDSTAFLPDSSR